MKIKIVKKKLQKNVCLSIGFNGVIRVTAPVKINQIYLDRIIESYVIQIKSEYPERFINKTPNHLELRKQFLQNKTEARNIVLKIIQGIDPDKRNFRYDSIQIKDNLTNWGSCSNNKNLNFNYRIVFLPFHLQFYLVIHELCHLNELNHSKRFWELVAYYCPDYKKLNNELKKIRISSFLDSRYPVKSLNTNSIPK